MPTRTPPPRRTPAQQNADKAFKTSPPEKPLTERQQENNAFDTNHARLKTERLLREADAKKNET
jgi:hypothetical protein